MRGQGTPDPGTSAPRPRRHGWSMHGWSIARRLFLGNLVFVVVLAVFVGTASFVDARDRGYSETADRMLAVATVIADSPLVVTAARSSDPTAALQAYTLTASRDADLDFITIMSVDGIRWTHPTPGEIGRPYIGETDPALAGRPFTEVRSGTLGPSVRAVAPIVGTEGEVVGLVAAGVTTSNLSIALAARLPAILALALALLVAGSLGTWVLGRYLRRVTLGWGPEDLAQLFVYTDSVLHSVREGLVLVSRAGELVLYNDQAATLLGIPPRPSGRPVGTAPAIDDLDLPPSVAELLRSGRIVQDEIHLTSSRVLILNQEPAVPTSTRSRNRSRNRNPAIGTVVTIRDHTDLQMLGSELASTRTLSDALRAQTHEHANRLHTIVSLMELGRSQEALDFATQDLAVNQQLTDEMISSVDEPVIGALLVGKFAQAAELGVLLRVTATGVLADSGLSVRDLVTVLGNLVDNALDAAASGEPPRRVDVDIRSEPPSVLIEVADSGRGVAADDLGEVFSFGYSTKDPGSSGRGLGLALVQQAVGRLGGTIAVSRRTGAVFTVTVPLHATPVDPAPAADVEASPHG